MANNNFFSEDAMNYYSGDETFNQIFPSSTTQSPPSIMYSSPLQHHQQLPHRASYPQPYTAHYMHQQQPAYSTNTTSAYTTQQYWPTHSTAYAQPTYSTYPPPTGTLAPTTAYRGSYPVYGSSQAGSTRASPTPSVSSQSGLAIPTSGSVESSVPGLSRSLSPSAPDLRAYGHPNKNGTWSCAYPGCTSRAVFTRGCDLRKHYKRHTKSFFCRHEGCPQSVGGGFSSKKDLARHEAKHNPGVMCEWEGCDRVFSRVDNMRDHVKRIHLKGSRSSK